MDQQTKEEENRDLQNELVIVLSILNVSLWAIIKDF